MKPTPDTELSTKDKGDDMQRRLRYQAEYATWKAISMLNPESEIESLFCEHHEDLLVQLKRGRFVGVQVKTRESNRRPFIATDSQILGAIARFIQLDVDYPDSFERFVIATNHGFSKEKGAQSLPSLIALCADVSEDVQSDVRVYLAKLNKEASTAFTDRQLRQVVAKLTLEPALPQFEDFETVIADRIAQVQEYANVTRTELRQACTALKNQIQRMSSLEVPRFVEVVFKSNPKEYETEKLIAGKRLTPHMVHASINTSVAPMHFGSPDSIKTTRSLPTLSASSLERIQERFQKASRKLLGWPTTLDGSIRLESSCLDLIKKAIEDHCSSIQFVLGPPGSGKSALLAVLSNAFVQGGDVVLAFKADQLETSIDSDDKLQEALDLEAPLDHCVREIAKRKRVIIIFDQLDALSDLTCLNPERLTTLLKQIEKLAEVDNVHIVASAREFDADHDPRLRSLDAIRVHLTLPEWEQITPVLDARHVRYAAWTGDVRMLLRTPQYLKIFLDLHGTDSHCVFESYRALLNTLWKLRVEDSTGSKERVVESIAERMSKFEQLIVPSAAYAAERAIVDALIAAHILQEDVGSGTITFTHQTLFEYVRARTFLRGTDSLSAYIVERQNSLFVRPQLWNALNHMRDGDSGQYRCEVSSLIGNPDLRFHLRLLLIEFLGQIAEPRDYEISWVLPLLNDDGIRPMVLSSLSGSPGWYRKLSDAYLPASMRAGKEKATEVAPLLRGAINFERDGVLELIERNWLVNKETDFLTLSILDASTLWCDRICKIACSIIERSDVNPLYVDQMCVRANEASPQRAAQLILSQLKAMLGQAPQAGLLNAVTGHGENENDLSRDPTYLDLRKDYDCPRRKALLALVDRDDLYIFDDLVESHPQIFIETLWSWFTEVMSEIVHQSHDFIDAFPTDGSRTALDDDDGNRKYSIIGAMDAALFRFAKESPSIYCRFVERNKDIQSQTVQRLFARSLIATVESEPSVAWQFLIEDARRLSLGSLRSAHRDSVILIKALYPNLNETQRQALDVSIAQYSHYAQQPQEDEAKIRFKRRKWDREHRLKLLQAIPRELIPAELGKLRDEEERALPNIQQDVEKEFAEASWVTSPMSVDQMSRASVEDLLSLFQELNDKTGHTHPKDFLKGGTIQLSRNLGELAKIDAEKVLKLLEQFEPASNSIAAAEALSGLGAAGLAPETQFGLMIELDNRGFRGAEFRGTVASRIRALSESVPIPTDIVQLLRRYLKEHSGGPAQVVVRQKDQRSESSVLWGRSSTEDGFCSSNTFPLVSALTEIYLDSEPPMIEEWLLMLEELALKSDLSDYHLTWRLLSPLLVRLQFADHQRANALLTTLLTQKSSPLLSGRGTFLFAYTHGWLTEELVQLWLKTLFSSSWVDGKQVYGELLTLHHIWFPERTWAKAALNALCADCTDIKNKDALIGVAYTVGHLWSNGGHREGKSEILVALLRADEDVFLEALSDGLVQSLFPIDAHTQSLLAVLATNRKLLRSLSIDGVLQNLHHLADWYPENVYHVCLAIIEEFGADIGDIRTHYAAAAADLIELVMRLQRQNEPARSWGLELFERLIDLRIPDARAMLNALDRRVDAKNVASSARLRSRTARRRRAKNNSARR